MTEDVYRLLEFNGIEDMERAARVASMTPEHFIEFAKLHNQAVSDVELARERHQTLSQYFAEMRKAERKAQVRP